MIRKIKKGERFICVKSFFMDDKEKAYTSGKIYISEIDNCITDNSLDTKHEMDGFEEKEFLIYFKPHPDNILIKGDRFNTGKPRWSLIDYKSLIPFIKVLEFGSEKYSDDNWKKGLKEKEILESAMRHLTSMMDGEHLDPESGLPHSAHVMCNMMFYSYHYPDGRILEENK